MRNRIQELRKERKIRQEDLADAVGVTRQTIISLENASITRHCSWRTGSPGILRNRSKIFFYLRRSEYVVE